MTQPGKPRTSMEQVDKFRRVAQDNGCDDSEEAFDAALRKIGKAKAKVPKKE